MPERCTGEPKDQDKLDREYAARFWKRQPEGMREVFQRTIESAAQLGRLSIFVTSTGLTEQDREKLSALRALAQELGYTVGQFVLDRKTHTASASITRKS